MIFGIFLLIPLDVAVVPLQAADRIHEKLRITDAEMNRALLALARARCLGFKEQFISDGWYGRTYYLDQIGYPLPDLDDGN